MGTSGTIRELLRLAALAAIAAVVLLLTARASGGVVTGGADTAVGATVSAAIAEWQGATASRSAEPPPPGWTRTGGWGANADALPDPHTAWRRSANVDLPPPVSPRSVSPVEFAGIPRSFARAAGTAMEGWDGARIPAEMVAGGGYHEESEPDALPLGLLCVVALLIIGVEYAGRVSRAEEWPLPSVRGACRESTPHPRIALPSRPGTVRPAVGLPVRREAA